MSIDSDLNPTGALPTATLPTVTLLASGLKRLSFQGVTTFRGQIVVATVEADLLIVGPDQTVTPWKNLARYGVPTGIVGLKDGLAVALSGQETGHFLMQVSSQGQVSTLADLSALAGEFGAPFAVVAYEGYYPYYLVAISTNVSGSAGLIARVTRSGKLTVLARLNCTPFGIGLGEDYVIATQDNGQILRVSLAGETRIIADLEQAQLGIPLDLTRLGRDWMITTSTGWLVALKPDDTLIPVSDLAAASFGLPTTLTALENQTANQLVVVTQSGNLVQVTLA